MTMPANAGAPVDDKPEEAPGPSETVFNEDSEKDYKAGHAASPTSPPAEGQAEQVESVDTPAETTPPEPSPEASIDATPEPAVFPDSPELTQLRQQNAAYQQQAASQQQAYAQQQAAQQIQQLVDQRVAQEISELAPIHGEEVAKQFGERHRQLYTQMGQMQQQAQQQMTEQAAKVQIAMKLAEQDGSSMTELMQLSTPQAMVAASAQSKVIRGLQEDAAKAKRATVPAQEMNPGQTSAKAASTDARIVAKFAEVGMDGLSDTEKAVIEKKYG